MNNTIIRAEVPEGSQVFFSIIVPMYNRAATIRRCLDSCLSQDFDRYEVIVVDDSSEDDSVATVESYLPNPHIVLVKNPQNRGVCFARGSGVKHARGKWVMFIDSDDAFHPGAFQTIYEEVNNVPPEVSEVRFCYFCEAIGKVTPIPMMPEGILGFPEYLKWYGEYIKLGKKANSDLLYCQRREIYDFTSWPADRQHETLYHVELASKIKMIMSRKVIGTMYDDAPDRVTRQSLGQPSWKSQIIIRDNANARAKILRDYGKQIKQYCPNWYESSRRNTGRLYMQCGEKLKGCRYLLKYLTMRPFSLSGWGILILGLIQRDALNWCLRKLGR